MRENSLVPELSVFDFNQSLMFYKEILGFEIKYQRTEEGFAFLTLGDCELMIDQIDKGRVWKTAELELPLGRGVNFQIRVKNVEQLVEKLQSKGIKLFMELEEKWYRKDNSEVGNKQFLIQDPDGYLLRFYQDLGERKLKSPTK